MKNMTQIGLWKLKDEPTRQEEDGVMCRSAQPCEAHDKDQGHGNEHAQGQRSEEQPQVLYTAARWPIH